MHTYEIYPINVYPINAHIRNAYVRNISNQCAYIQTAYVRNISNQCAYTKCPKDFFQFCVRNSGRETGVALPQFRSSATGGVVGIPPVYL